MGTLKNRQIESLCYIVGFSDNNVLKVYIKLVSYSLLVQILRNLKDAFWPFQHDQSGNLFLRAARAAYFIDVSNVNEDRYFSLMILICC